MVQAIRWSIPLAFLAASGAHLSVENAAQPPPALRQSSEPCVSPCNEWSFSTDSPVAITPVFAQTASRAAGAQSKPGASRPAATDRAALEKQLEAALRNVVFTGSWRMADEKEKKLSAAHTDRYAIESAHKADGDWWVIQARIQYEENDVTLPIRVRIVWAEDTPVITLDDLKLPGLGEYSARVMLFRGYYAGAWFAAGHGGVLSGRILPGE